MNKKTATPSESIVLKNYGPVSTKQGSSFNIQPDGSSAFWFEIESIYSSFVVLFDSLPLRTSSDMPIVSATIPQELLGYPGTFRINIVSKENEKDFISLDFTIEQTCRDGEQVHRIRRRPTTKPNFFIVGAPRSGTTSMYWHLSTHPNIFMSNPKEPFFFDERAHGVLPEAITTMEEYLSLFKFAPYGTTILGEASTTYLSSRAALERIKKFNSEAKILVMLRNPIKASLSMFLRMREGGVNEDISDFDVAWEKSGQEKRTLINNYQSLFMLGDQLQTVLELFAAANVKILFFDDLASDSARIYLDVLDFLGLSKDDKDILGKKNSAQWKAKEEIFSQETYKKMIAHFSPQIEKLTKLTKRDLSEWTTSYENF